jgi:predicted transcriptional regulator/DNA-binding XRE family transcriptional regulator
MTKVFMGARLLRVRKERNLTQASLAELLGISPSYLNQIENNQRPLTVPVLLKIGSALNIDPQIFSEHESANLVADLRDVLSDLPGSEPATIPELKMLVENMPGMARAILQLQHRYRMAAEKAESLELQLDHSGTRQGQFALSADEEVRDYLNQRQNYIAGLDEAAEQVADNTAAGLQHRLLERHGVTLSVSSAHPSGNNKSYFDRQKKILYLPESMTPGQRTFQIAVQLGRLEQHDIIENLVSQARLSGVPASDGLRLALSNYYAGAVLMPYRRFLAAAETLGYDIELLAQGFGVGFEAVCHRLSTMQRPGDTGLPVFFIRVDRAGNVSKRQSATAFHFSRVGGTCPLWIVYEAFSQPGRVLRQIAQMPDGGIHLWVAKQVSSGAAGFQAAAKSFAVALGCELSHAHRLVYSKGLDLHNPSVATAIGSGCKVCERNDCPQRAFPSIIKG